MMALEPVGAEPERADVWVGAGPRYPWGGLYQIVAQALRSATFSVDARYRVHSLHAYFIRSGDHTEPIRFEVDRVRDGRSFCTRRVTARQSVGVILDLAASYQADEPGPQVHTAVMPELTPPGQLPDNSWSETSSGGWRRGCGARSGRGHGWPSRSATTRRCTPARWPTSPTTSPPRPSCR